MSFYLKQFIQEESDNETAYMNLITDGMAAEIQKANPDDELGSLFKNQCVKRDSFFEVGIAYYFHGKIFRLSGDQEFSVRLTNSNRYSESDFANQYLRSYKINALKGGTEIEEDKWFDIEFIFVPFKDNYNAIVFELTRDPQLDLPTSRVPIICYEELSSIGNAKTRIGLSSGQIVKLGIQARPSSILCLNQEGIRVPLSGILEMKDGTIPIDFISFVSAAKEKYDAMKDLMQSVEENPTIAESACFFEEEKVRPIKTFAIDFMYDDTPSQQ